MDNLIKYGWQPESSPLQASHYALATPGVAATYSNSYGRFSVLDNLCGLSFASTDLVTNLVTAVKPLLLPTSFGDGNGVPPMLGVTGLSSGITVVNNLDPRGQPLLDSASQSPSTNREDFNFDGALCQCELMTGSTTNASRVQLGVQQVQKSANLQGKPAIIVHGRSDTLVPTNFSSRPYYAQNKVVEGSASKLRYIEVTNAQHFDAFLANPALGFNTLYIPLHVYFNRALDAMYEHLTTGAALPPSQVVKTEPRGVGAPPITSANVPPISATPGSNAILFDGTTLTIPD